MTTAQFLTLLGVLSEIETRLCPADAKLTILGHLLLFLSIGTVNLLMYCIFRSAFPSSPSR
jgi:hypothetical protein